MGKFCFWLNQWMRTDTEIEDLFENHFSYLIKYFVFASIDPFIKSFYP